MSNYENFFPCAGCGTGIRAMGSKTSWCPCQCECKTYYTGVEHNGHKETQIDPCKPCMVAAATEQEFRDLMSSQS